MTMGFSCIALLRNKKSAISSQNYNHMKPLEQLLRPNIKRLEAYSCARDEFSGEANIYLDANENPFNKPFNRYPDPLQKELKQQIARLKQTDSDQLFLGNGSDEAIDLLFRAFCEPGKDEVVSISPTYGMYRVCADINNTLLKSVPLSDDFSLNAEKILEVCDEKTKLIFLCSPNNPSGNLLQSKEIAKILTAFTGLVVIDEAYVDFAPAASWLPNLKDYPNLVLLQTFSKAWGMAGVRLGMAFASKELIAILNKIKYPYNLNVLTQQLALELLKDEENMLGRVEILLSERSIMDKKLKEMPGVEHVYPSDANFLLVKMKNAGDVYKALTEQGTIVRDRSGLERCANCLRITVGTPDENSIFLNQLEKILLNEKNTIIKDYPLKIHNTFGIDIRANRFLAYDTEQSLIDALPEIRATERPLLMIGEGSNLLFLNDFKGFVLHSQIGGFEITDEDEDYVNVRVGGGVIWDDFVAWTVQNGFGGVENLSIIPGTVGASPVQNVGAYGVEVKDVITQVETITLGTGKRRVFSNADCHFAYRNSIFKGELKGKCAVTYVNYRLDKRHRFKLDYGHINALLKGEKPSLQRIRQVIKELRESKLPDHHTLGNAGSFFTNPYVSVEQFEPLKKQYPKIPHYQTGERKVKIPAAWLIEQCGLKGMRHKNAAVHKDQPLVLVNMGGAGGEEILELAHLVIAKVKDAFGITLVPEVDVIGE